MKTALKPEWTWHVKEPNRTIRLGARSRRRGLRGRHGAGHKELGQQGKEFGFHLVQKEATSGSD